MMSPTVRKRGLPVLDSPGELGTFGKRHQTGNGPTAARTAGTGLVRVGNTCFINATLAVLLRVPRFRELLHAAKAAGAQPAFVGRQPLLDALLKVGSDFDTNPHSVVHINAILQVSYSDSDCCIDFLVAFVSCSSVRRKPSRGLCNAPLRTF